MIKKYRKKPVVIEALRWTGEPVNQREMHDFLTDTVGQEMKDAGRHFHILMENGGCQVGTLVIHTLEGEMKASLGDWIIKGINGEYYPCKPDIFDKTYEEVAC